MTRTPSGARWRAASAALALSGLLAAGATPAFAAEPTPDLTFPSTKTAPDAAGSDVPSSLRAQVSEASAESLLARSGIAPAGVAQRVNGSDATAGAAAGAGAGAAISGTITYWKNGVSAGALSTGYASAWRWDDAAGEYVQELGAPAAANGAYTIAGLPAGDYVVLFSDTAGTVLRAEFWDDAQFLDWTPVITLADGDVRTGVDEQLEPLLKGRIAGADRFETAVGVSSSYPTDVPCVFVANGLDYPDALSAGPAAAHCGGPLLLVRPTQVPDVVFEELQRLSPERIVIAGGIGAVSATVESVLTDIAPVTRYGGIDRYDTSRKIVASEFGTSTGMWVATGANFPDALAASAGAAAADVPVLIVPGGATALDSASAGAITNLGASEIGIAGGPGVISLEFQETIQALPGVQTTNRAGGIDRYWTAWSIMRTVFGADADAESGWAPYAFFASGTNFPDALAGAPLAGALGAPLYVTPASCVIPMIAWQVESLQVAEAFVLGFYQQQLYYNGWEPFKEC